MADLEKIAEELSNLTVLEASELSKILEEKWGVSAAAPVAAMWGGDPGECSQHGPATHFHPLPAAALPVVVCLPLHVCACVRVCVPPPRSLPLALRATTLSSRARPT